nr:hypothetical protein [Tanacetum cinerariifolium]
MAPKKAASKQTTRLNPDAASNPNQAPSTTTTTITNAQLQDMIDQGVNAALAARDAKRTGDDSHTSGTGVKRIERVTRECTYQDFMKCQLLYFKGTEGVVELTQWIVGNDAAYVMTWIGLKKKMADKYYPRDEMKKIETEQAANTRKFKDTSRNNQGRQQPPKRQDVARAYAAGSGNRQQYAGYCPKLKNNNNNRGNQVGTGNAQERVYVVVNAGTNPDANTVMGTFLLNNCYASVLFDSR